MDWVLLHIEPLNGVGRYFTSPFILALFISALLPWLQKVMIMLKRDLEQELISFLNLMCKCISNVLYIFALSNDVQLHLISKFPRSMQHKIRIGNLVD